MRITVETYVETTNQIQPVVMDEISIKFIIFTLTNLANQYHIPILGAVFITTCRHLFRHGFEKERLTGLSLKQFGTIQCP